MPVCWLTVVLHDIEGLLSTHDLSRVVVERTDPGSKTKMRWIFNLTGKVGSDGTFLSYLHSDMWLQDGDVIIIPQKTDKLKITDYPFKIGTVRSPSRRPATSRR